MAKVILPVYVLDLWLELKLADHHHHNIRYYHHCCHHNHHCFLNVLHIVIVAIIVIFVHIIEDLWSTVSVFL